MIHRGKYCVFYDYGRWWAIHKKMGGRMYHADTREGAIELARTAYRLYKKVGVDEYYDNDWDEDVQQRRRRGSASCF